MLTLLAPFYEATKMLSGATYATLNMVYSTMCFLKKTVAPPEGQDEEYYANLLYGEVGETTGQRDFSLDDTDPAVRVNQPLNISRGRQGRRIGRNTQSTNRIHENADPRFKNRRTIEPPVTTTNILEQVKATIYLSMCQYWDVPKETTLLAALLDPRFKKLKFVTEEQRNTTINNLKQLFQTEQAIVAEESANNPLPNLSEPLTADNSANSRSSHKVNYLLLGMYEDSDDDNDISDDEVSRYLALPKEGRECEPLKWWKSRVTIFPILSRLAMKYLSIPATSVPSERLFSDAGLHLSARRTCLKPELLGSMLFLKRNMQLFDIFKPNDK
jgi:hypothetical protein